MSEANDLLNNLTEEEMAEYSGGKVMVGVEDNVLYMTSASYDPTEEPHIVVGTDRYVIVPDELKRIAVQFDHDIETVTFDCPRFWDGHDMSQMYIYINYKNGTNKGSYLAQNIMIESDIMHFDWTISRNVTQYKGPITFLVCVKRTDEETGEEVNHWNSELNSEMYVSEGMECTEEYWSNYPDLLNQLLARQDYVDSIGATTEEAVGNYLLNHADQFQGPMGPKGDPGDKGDTGKSAYEYALEGGYSGTETEFIAKLSEETIRGTFISSGTSTTVDVTKFDYFIVKLETHDASTPPVLTESRTYALDNVTYNYTSGAVTAYGYFWTKNTESYTPHAFSLEFSKQTDTSYNIKLYNRYNDSVGWTESNYTHIYGFKRNY